MSNHHLTVKQLSERWGLSTGTLDHWRRYGKAKLFSLYGVLTSESKRRPLRLLQESSSYQ